MTNKYDARPPYAYKHRVHCSIRTLQAIKCTAKDAWDEANARLTAIEVISHYVIQHPRLTT